MRKISFPMGKWASNSEPLKNIWRANGLETEAVTRVLGVSWDTVGIASSWITETSQTRRGRRPQRRDSFKQPQDCRPLKSHVTSPHNRKADFPGLMV